MIAPLTSLHRMFASVRWLFQSVLLALLVVPVSSLVQAGKNSAYIPRPSLPLFGVAKHDERCSLPFFVKGSGRLTVVQDDEPVRGELYFLRVSEPPAGGVSVGLKKVSGSSVQASLGVTPLGSDNLILEVDPGGSEFFMKNEVHQDTRGGYRRKDTTVLCGNSFSSKTSNTFEKSRNRKTTQASITEESSEDDRPMASAEEAWEAWKSRRARKGEDSWETDDFWGAEGSKGAKGKGAKGSKGSKGAKVLASFHSDSGGSRELKSSGSYESNIRIESDRLDTVAAAGLLNQTRKQIEERRRQGSIRQKLSVEEQMEDLKRRVEKEADIGPTAREVRELFPTDGKFQAYADDDIILGGTRRASTVSIGFAGRTGKHDIITSVILRPDNPWEGMVVGPVQIQHRDGTRQLYAFRFRALNSGSYRVGAYRLSGDVLEEERDRLTSLLNDQGGDYLFHLDVVWDGSMVIVELEDGDGARLGRLFADVERIRDDDNHRFSLFPLPGSSGNMKTYLPGIGACINILSEALVGHTDVSALIDKKHARALFVPQIGRAHQSGSTLGVYRSDVPRNYETLVSYDGYGSASVADKVLDAPSDTWDMLSRNKTKAMAVLSAAALASAWYFGGAASVVKAISTLI